MAILGFSWYYQAWFSNHEGEKRLSYRLHIDLLLLQLPVFSLSSLTLVSSALSKTKPCLLAWCQTNRKQTPSRFYRWRIIICSRARSLAPKSYYFLIHFFSFWDFKDFLCRKISPFVLPPPPTTSLIKVYAESYSSVSFPFFGFE